MCKKCFRKLNPEDHLIQEYLRDQGIGECEDKLFSLLKAYIRTHLYGIVFVCSVLITTVAITVNVASSENHFEVVQNKPTEVIAYVGNGLTEDEIVKKYIDAILSDDFKTVKNLQLETFYPNVREEIKDINKRQWVGNPIMNHDLVGYGKYYVKDAAPVLPERYFLSKLDSEDLHMNQNNQYGDYTYQRYLFITQSCDKGDCSIDGALYGRTKDLIELIEVDGNYYVNGEMMGPFMGEDEYVFQRYVQRIKGNLSKYRHELFVNEILSECVENDSCLEEKGVK